MISLFGESMPTKEAREAQDVLRNSFVSLNLQEYQSLMETSRQTEKDPVFNETVLTSEAREAQDILQHSSVSLNLQEYQSLSETSKQTTNYGFIR